MKGNDTFILTIRANDISWAKFLYILSKNKVPSPTIVGVRVECIDQDMMESSGLEHNPPIETGSIEELFDNFTRKLFI